MLHTNKTRPTDQSARHATVNACLYRVQHGQEPVGHGWWTFDFYTRGTCLARHRRYAGNWSTARHEAQADAARIGATQIELLP